MRREPHVVLDVNLDVNGDGDVLGCLRDEPSTSPSRSTSMSTKRQPIHATLHTLSSPAEGLLVLARVLRQLLGPVTCAARRALELLEHMLRHVPPRHACRRVH